MKRVHPSKNRAIRAIFAAVAFSPVLVLAACDLRKPDTSDGGASASATAPATAVVTATATDTAAATVAPIVPATPATLAGAKRTGKTVKLPDGGTGAVLTLSDGGTAIVASNADGGIPGFPNFTIPTALPSGMTIPSAIPTTLPSGFPTTLPSGFHLPTFPTAAPSASH